MNTKWVQFIDALVGFTCNILCIYFFWTVLRKNLKKKAYNYAKMQYVFFLCRM